MLTVISWLFDLWPLEGSDGLASPNVCRPQTDCLLSLLELMVRLSNGFPLSSPWPQKPLHSLTSVTLYSVADDSISVLALLPHLNSSFQAGY